MSVASYFKIMGLLVQLFLCAIVYVVWTCMCFFFLHTNRFGFWHPHWTTLNLNGIFRLFFISIFVCWIFTDRVKTPLLRCHVKGFCAQITSRHQVFSYVILLYVSLLCFIYFDRFNSSITVVSLLSGVVQSLTSIFSLISYCFIIAFFHFCCSSICT